MKLEIGRKVYIGDGVYAYYDGYHLVLMVEDKKIYLDHHTRAILRRMLNEEREEG